MTYFKNNITNELLTRAEALKEIKQMNKILGTQFTLTDCVKDKVYTVITKGGK